MNRYEFNAVHVIDPEDSLTFREELKAEYRLFSVAVSVKLIDLIERDKALETLEHTLRHIPGHGSAEAQEYCLDRAVNDVRELLIENPDKLIELAKLEPPRFLTGGDDTTAAIADTERGDVTLLHKDTMDGESDAQELAAFLDERGLGRVTLVVSYKDNAGSFEYAKRMASIRFDFMNEAITYTEFSSWVADRLEEGEITEEEAKAITPSKCLHRNSPLIAAHMGIGYAKRADYGHDGGYDDEMISSLACIAPHVDATLRSYGEDLEDTRLRIAQKFGNVCEEKHCSSPAYAIQLTEKLISEQFAA